MDQLGRYDNHLLRFNIDGQSTAVVHLHHTVPTSQTQLEITRYRVAGEGKEFSDTMLSEMPSSTLALRHAWHQRGRTGLCCQAQTPDQQTSTYLPGQGGRIQL